MRVASDNARRKRHLVVSLAETAAEVRQAQRLRYRVFAEEMGAMLHSRQPGMDCDAYDEHCDHLLVRDLATGEVVGYTRILTDSAARRAGGYYSHGEFELANVLRLRGRFIEIGRTCVHPDYRNGATIAILWSGLARYITEHEVDYLMGCASIDLRDGGDALQAIMRQLRERHMTGRDLRVIPRLPVPVPRQATQQPHRLPPLLKAYLSLGAKICGEPCWDPAFRVADVFVLFDLHNLSDRYARHFLTPRCNRPVRQVA